MESKDIAIVGMSVFAPQSTNIQEYWNNLISGKDCIVEIPNERVDSIYFDKNATSVDRLYCNRGGVAPEINFDPVKYSMLPLAVEGMDTIHMMTLQMVYEALEDAGVFEKNISLDRASFILGKGNYAGNGLWRAIEIVHIGEQLVEILKKAAPHLSEEELDMIKKDYQKSRGRYQADSMPGIIPNLIASLVANKLNMHGPAYTIDAACASSLVAVEHSIKELLSGRCDIALAGGVHAGHNATFWSIFAQLGALSRKQKITPFSEDADGLLIGEAAGVVVLKRLETALKHKDRIYAVIKGVGVSSDGGGVSPMAPSSRGQVLAIREAWKNAGLDTKRLGYIEAHGTGTIVGDKVEMASLSEVFPKEDGFGEVLLGSVKSNVGHTMPAAGVLGLIKTALALYHRQIPPTLHCERPMKEMLKSRFSPVQKLTPWDESKYPLVAGVNAFGFGGINAHVILEAYGEKEEDKKKTQLPFIDKVAVLTAPSKDLLLQRLKKQDLSISNNKGGNYRLIIFNPTPERIEKAIMIVEMDKVWKGRLDIWFSNDPLLSKGGKIAFLYPGFDPGSSSEIDSVMDYFGYDLPNYIIEESDLLNKMFEQGRACEAITKALNNLGVKADMSGGHSLGEWHAMRCSNMISSEMIQKLFAAVDLEGYVTPDVYFVAVGAGLDKINNYLAAIPDLYLSNDNCTNQVLLCGKKEAIDCLSVELQKENIYYYVLPYQSGFHTPYAKEKIYLIDKNFEFLVFDKPENPVWSTTILDVYPEDIKTIKELFVKHLIEPVQFRELILKLYKEQDVKVFIQLGVGSLVGFIEDILIDKPYNTISTSTPYKTTLEQLRRVIALLFVEGRNVDLSFLNPIRIDSNASKSSVNLPMKQEITKDFPLLEEILKKKSAMSHPFTREMNLLYVENENPVIRALNNNLQNIIQLQQDMVAIFEARSGNQQPKLFKQKAQSQSIIPNKENEIVISPEKTKEKTGQIFQADYYVSLAEHPQLLDHSLIRQPDGWPDQDDLNPVVPMTMTIELLAEAVLKQMPSKKVLVIGPISVFQWIEVVKPFSKKITGVWKSEETVSLNLSGFASGDITLGDSYLKPETYYETHIDLGETVKPIPNIDTLYQYNLFHGPDYRGIVEIKEITEKGIRATVKAGKGKGSLLDSIGQAYGYYLQLFLEYNFVTFPVKTQEMIFYQDFLDQEGLFEITIIRGEETDTFTHCDVVLKRDNKVWCVVKGWQNRRFEFDMALWRVTLNPERVFLAKEIAPNVFYYDNSIDKPYIWNFLIRRYLNRPEKKRFNSLPLNQRKNFLIGRVALKDNLRSNILNQYDKETYPIEFFINYDTNGKPSVSGIEEINGLEISLAHKKSRSVSIVSDKPVGIDIEQIEERGQGFMDLTFTDHEKSLLEKKDVAEWSTRFWAAKEAYGKKLGIGLQGNPKRYEVKKIVGDDMLIIEDCDIKMMKLNNNMVVVWTI